MKNIITLFILVVLTNQNILAKNVEKRLKVTSISLDSEKKLYRVSFYSMAGVYWADSSKIECLKKSIHSKKKATLTYDVHSLVISKCEF